IGDKDYRLFSKQVWRNIDETPIRVNIGFRKALTPRHIGASWFATNDSPICH
ncbi:hypothetical protein HAX54_008198, partial [Datura stramonium]|nr:hypothetical protein [Datura stramonium]